MGTSYMRVSNSSSIAHVGCVRMRSVTWVEADQSTAHCAFKKNRSSSPQTQAENRRIAPLIAPLLIGWKW